MMRCSCCSQVLELRRAVMEVDAKSSTTRLAACLASTGSWQVVWRLCNYFCLRCAPPSAHAHAVVLYRLCQVPRQATARSLRGSLSTVMPSDVQDPIACLVIVSSELARARARHASRVRLCLYSLGVSLGESIFFSSQINAHFVILWCIAIMC
jgi:hypothetical protein